MPSAKRRVLVAAVALLALTAWFVPRQQALDEVHRLPPGYVGTVFILFNQPDGEPPRTDSAGRRLYEIPPSGVLRTQTGPVYGPRNITFLQPTASGEDIELELDVGADILRHTPGIRVYGASIGTINRAWFCGDSSWSGADDIAYTYNQYIVGPLAMSDSLSRAAEAQIMGFAPPPARSPDCTE